MNRFLSPEVYEDFSFRFKTAVTNLEDFSYELKLNIGREVKYFFLIAHQDTSVKDGVIYNGVFQDVSCRKQYEISKSGRNETILRETIRIANIGIYDHDLLNNTSYWSKEVYNILELDEDVEGLNTESFLQFIHEDDIEQVLDTYSNFHFSKSYAIKYRVIINGRVKYLQEWGKADFDENDIMISYYGIVNDLTELVEAKQKAEESDRLKSNFLGVVSHEIRTPMNSIIGYSQLLGMHYETLTQDKREKYIALIEKNSQSLLFLINDILDMAKIQSGELTLNKDDVVYINDLFHELFNIYSNELLAQEKDKVKLEYSSGLDSAKGVLHTDYNRLKQILKNLISNSIKFTDNGHIKYGYELENEMLNFWVEDTGIGIEENRLDEIFAEFSQQATGISRNYGGAGLGLAISSSLVNRLGGKIWVESELTKGSTFYFTIPYDLKLADDIENMMNNIDAKYS